MFIYDDLITKVKLFEFGDPSFIMAVVRFLHPKLCMNNDYICRKDEYADQMYFVREGCVMIIASDGETLLTKLSEGDYFGEIGCLI
jgi:CRP-like cAMP-binding protein